jgi:hypothetical protein
MILTLVFFSAQVPDMSSSSNPMAWIMSVEPLTGANYPSMAGEDQHGSCTI